MPSIRSLYLIGLWALCAVCLAAASASASLNETNLPASAGDQILAPRAAPWTTVDHSSHEALQQDFDSGPEVTEACLSCHNLAAKQVQETIHWTWLCPADPQGVMGKNGLTMNNF